MGTLDAFVNASKPQLSLQDLTKLTGLNKNTLFRVLYTLAEHGYIVKRGVEYELGPRLHDLSNVKLRPKDLLAVTGPHMNALRDRFGETVNLGVLDGGQIRYVDVRESASRFRLAERIGGSDYLHCTSLGKSYLAFLPGEEVKRLIEAQGMPQLTGTTITTMRGLTAELDRVRKQGYAVDREESMPGAFCVGVPILNSGCAPVAALSIAGPNTRFNEALLPEVSRALLEAAADIRARLGYE